MEPFPKHPAFHLMAKPCDPQCNLACGYCFYLPKKALYPKSAAGVGAVGTGSLP